MLFLGSHIENIVHVSLNFDVVLTDNISRLVDKKKKYLPNFKYVSLSRPTTYQPDG